MTKIECNFTVSIFMKKHFERGFKFLSKVEKCKFLKFIKRSRYEKRTVFNML